jgi:hypothetical protein
LTALLGETNTDDHHDVEKELGSQSDFTEVVDDAQTPQTPMINLSDSALSPKIRDRKMIDHLIRHGPKKVQLTHYPQDFSDSHYFRKLANNEFIK